MKRRWKGLACALALIAAAALGTWRTPAMARREAAVEPRNTPTSLELYYTPPVLVRAGERAMMPVDVICATSSGRPCGADLELGYGEPGRGWRTMVAGSVRQVRFDLSAPAARAGAGTGTVHFTLRARAGNQAVSLPPDGAPGTLQFHVTRDMPVVKLPTLRYGDVRAPTTVLFLPWGSGPMRAGLSFGHEAPMFGPPAFDIDRQGRVYLVDPLQDRLAVFAGGRLARAAHLTLHPGAVVAAGAGGASVLDHSEGSVRLRTVDPAGRVGRTVDLGKGIPSDVRTLGEEVLALVLPLDAWVRVTRGGARQVTTGRPFGSGRQLLRIGRERSVRLGMLSGGQVRGAVELRSTERFGEIALAEPDGRGGYVVVVRVWRQGPPAADQFQVAHLGASGRVLQTFAVSSVAYAEAAPMGRFRLGPDGHLYQLVTGADGVRIGRFDLEGGDR